MLLLRWTLVVLALTSFGMLVADHFDSPAVIANSDADITDLYTWMNADASKINIVMNVHPNAAVDAQFSSSIKYVINFSSMSAYGSATDVTNSQLICVFDSGQKISCKLGSETIDGDASVTTGLLSSSEKIKVFAGRRNDPFFFNLNGFNNATATIKSALTTATFDANGCPALGPGDKAIAIDQLQKNDIAGAEAAVDFFATHNVLSLVFEVDKSLVSTTEKPVVAVWASTHK